MRRAARVVGSCRSGRSGTQIDVLWSAIARARLFRVERVIVRGEVCGSAPSRSWMRRAPIDFVRYAYPPLEPPLEMFGVGLAGVRDLAVMKLAAISRRGLRRDFWDLREALGTGLTLRQCGEAYVQRFGVREADLYHVLRALTYFEDAEKDPVFPRGLDAPTWESIKSFFRKEAPRLLDV